MVNNRVIANLSKNFEVYTLHNLLDVVLKFVDIITYVKFEVSKLNKVFVC